MRILPCHERGGAHNSYHNALMHWRLRWHDVDVQDLQSTNPNRTPATKQLITLRLIMPASQCGSLIGKGGAKIKEIREVGTRWVVHPIIFRFLKETRRFKGIK